MMKYALKIRLYSDIHNEILRACVKSKNYTPWVPPEMPDDKETILILAGDIDKLKQIPDYLNSLSPRFKSVIHVAGNHEFYGDTLSNYHKMSEGLEDNVFHLNNSVVEIDGVRFAGTTMWTGLGNNPLTELAIQSSMNDYRCIRYGYKNNYRRIIPKDVTSLHDEAISFLQDNIDNNTVVITHHCPLSPENILKGCPPYGVGVKSVDYAYYACIEELMLEKRPIMWCYGHTHNNINTEYFGIRLVANCLGYHTERNDDTEYLINI